MRAPLCFFFLGLTRVQAEERNRIHQRREDPFFGKVFAAKCKPFLQSLRKGCHTLHMHIGRRGNNSHVRPERNGTQIPQTPHPKRSQEPLTDISPHDSFRFRTEVLTHSMSNRGPLSPCYCRQLPDSRLILRSDSHADPRQLAAQLCTTYLPFLPYLSTYLTLVSERFFTVTGLCLI